MREIKFRAYIPTLNKVCFKGKGLTLDEIRRLDEGYFRDDVVWVEYTGLKDKNGKEIYEGDIVKVECECGFVGNSTVEYKHNAFRLNYPYQHRFSSGELEFNRMNRVEVIGNIYENPELLTTKTEELII